MISYSDNFAMSKHEESRDQILRALARAWREAQHVTQNSQQYRAAILLPAIEARLAQIERERAEKVDVRGFAIQVGHEVASWVDPNDPMPDVECIVDELLSKQPKVADVLNLLRRCRDFIDTTQVPSYPAGAELADEIDAVLGENRSAPRPSDRP